jgi:hypothetical protein
MRSTTSCNRLLTPLAIVAVIVGAGVIVYANRDPIRAHWSQQRRAVVAASESSHPVVTELAVGMISPGDPIDALVTRHPPTDRFVHDRYTTVCYVEGNRETYIVARDGRLMFARQCGYGVHSCTFFSTMTRDDEQDWSASFQRAQPAPDAGNK